MNRTYNNLDSIIQLSKDRETLGFDLNAGQTWIYPTNYQIRDYQFNITQAALHNNTLVSLPTGLGKTFIAAVVMYNFFRWYPMGKIIFMAPTRPLVKQQQDACYNITAIPPDTTVEMTGNKASALRGKIWKEKRVFFITPQILQHDIDVVLELAEEIKCLVIDEAHKALGKHANVEAIKKIYKINKYFRILALSATPGSNFNSIKDVITNLLISHIEARSNESEDVAPYVFKRKLDTFVIPITGQLLNTKNKYIRVLDKYTRPLLEFNLFIGNCANLTKGRIVLVMKDFKEKGRNHKQYGFILKTLNLCITLYHGYELLIRHGLRGFLVFFDGTISKPLINSIEELHGILDEVRNYLGPLEDVEMLPDGTLPEINGPVVCSHPKFEKLNEVLINHFEAAKEQDTRTMVFCEYRESVMEIYQLLLRQRPLIKPRVFLGQAAISQIQQLQAIKQFKSGKCNTLIATCIGEEGLDVGEVDLIVCFDISSKSPIRMVQRMGRTGRKRDGRVVVLVTEGKEQQLLSECMIQKNNMISLLESQPIKKHLYTNNPKMIPDNIQPECNKMFITVQEKEKPKTKETKKKNVTKKNTIKNLFDNINSENSEKTGKTKSPIKRTRKLPTPTKNQMDLRSMFSKISNMQSNPSIECTEEESGNNEESSELNALVTAINNYIKKSTENDETNWLFGDSLKTAVCSINNEKIITNNILPNVSIIDSITSDALKQFTKSLNKNTSNNTNIDDILQYFNLKSISDVFSDDSVAIENDFNEKAAIFNHSLGIFESSSIYNSPIKKEVDESVELFENQNTSPVLNTQRVVNYRHKIQRRLFSESQTTNLKTPKFEITKNTNISTPKNELQFWDESLFECFSSETSLIEEKKQNIEAKSSNNDLEEQENISNDSDETIILSLSYNTNQLIENNEQPNLKDEEKLLKSDIKIDSSLLSITQAIDLLNDSKFKPLDSSVKDATIENNNKTQISDICQDLDDFDEEFSLLSFTQSRKRKLQEKKPDETKTKFAKIEKQENGDKSKILKNKNTNRNYNKKNKLQLNPVKKVDKESNKTFKTISQISPLKLPPKKSTNNKIAILSDSDDDFEVLPSSKPISKLITPIKNNKKKHKTKKAKNCVFIDNEAEVEQDEHYVSDSESEKESEHSLDNSFVSYSQNVHDQTDMKVKYLESIKSPKFKPGAFKMPHPAAFRPIDVFSQVENNENETYMNDSFCVGNDEELSQREQMSYLEMIEVQLEKENKRNKKRKRIITISDSD